MKEKGHKKLSEESTEVSSSAKKEGGKTESSKAKRIAGWLTTALLVLVGVFCVVFVIRIKVFGKPFVFGHAVYRVVSSSMEPEIKKYDVIIIKEPKDVHTLQVGDTITYRAAEGAFANLPAGTPVTHRIVKIEGDSITTRGIANPLDDKPITYDQVIGIYVKTSPSLTWLATLFFSKYGFILVVFIPLIVLLAIQVVNFVRTCKMDANGKTPEEKTEEELKAQALKETEEEIKRRAIEEYIASQKQAEQSVEAQENQDQKE